MGIRRIRSTGHRFSVFALMLMALAVNALVPSGYMTSQAADGGITLTMCTGQGRQSAILLPDGAILLPGDIDTGDQQAPADNDDDGPAMPCAFAGNGTATSTGDPGGTLAEAEPVTTLPVVDAPRTLMPVLRMAAPPPSSHAPPLTLLT